MFYVALHGAHVSWTASLSPNRGRATVLHSVIWSCCRSPTILLSHAFSYKEESTSEAQLPENISKAFGSAEYRSRRALQLTGHIAYEAADPLKPALVHAPSQHLRFRCPVVLNRGGNVETCLPKSCLQKALFMRVNPQ